MSLSVHGQDLTFMSYNIRYNTQSDGDNKWEERKEDVAQLILEQLPDAFGVQEALYSQMKYLDSVLVDYKYIGGGRDDGRNKGEFSGVFYNTKVLRVFDECTFWLSLTPNNVSKGWDAALPRICTVARFEHLETSKHFFFFNTHFDHRGNMARFQSSLLIGKKMMLLNSQKLPVILTGDFNAKPRQRPIMYLSEIMDDAAQISKTDLEGPIGTFSGFDTKAKLNDRIDYIFSNGFEILSYRHLDKKRSNGLWPSDHLPVVVKAKFKLGSNTLKPLSQNK